MDFTVVIPVYNTDTAWIRDAVESVLQNKECKYEICLVDDGSSEQTATFLDRIHDKNKNVKVLHLPHKGVSAARNAGTAAAEGDYVVYLDADDRLIPGVLDRTAEYLRKETPDLLLTDIGRVCTDSPESVAPEMLYDTGKLRRYYCLMNVSGLRGKDHWLNRAPHGRFVKRELARAVPFRENLAFGEDMIWNMEILQRAGRIARACCQTYVYRKNPFSATQRERPEFPRELHVLFRFLKESCEGEEAVFRASAVEFFTILMRVYVFTAPPAERYARYRKEVKRSFWKEIFRKVDLSLLKGRYRLTAVLMRYRLYALLYTVYRVHHKG